MSTQSYEFKRLVVGLQASASESAMRLAVEFAQQLHLDLLGIFLDDANLRGLAAIPFAREFRLLQGWRRLDADQLIQDVEVAAKVVERTFERACRGLPSRPRFEVVRGLPYKTIASIAGLEDIVMVVEPGHPAERVSGQFTWFLRGALQSAAAVLLAPREIIRKEGPVVVIALTKNDPSIAVAAAIASATNDELIIVEINTDRAEKIPLTDLIAQKPDLQRVIAKVGTIDALLEAMVPLNERLVIMTRGASDGVLALAIASARRVPILVLEPPSRAGQSAISGSRPVSVQASSR
jgi:hypothetical protein